MCILAQAPYPRLQSRSSEPAWPSRTLLLFPSLRHCSECYAPSSKAAHLLVSQHDSPCNSAVRELSRDSVRNS